MSLTQNLKQQLLNHDRHYIGVGRVTAGRRGLFRSQEGLAVEMVQRVFEIPPCNGESRRAMLRPVRATFPCPLVCRQAASNQTGRWFRPLTADFVGAVDRVCCIHSKSATEYC